MQHGFDADIKSSSLAQNGFNFRVIHVKEMGVKAVKRRRKSCETFRQRCLGFENPILVRIRWFSSLITWGL